MGNPQEGQPHCQLLWHCQISVEAGLPTARLPAAVQPGLFCQQFCELRLATVVSSTTLPADGWQHEASLSISGRHELAGNHLLAWCIVLPMQSSGSVR